MTEKKHDLEFRVEGPDGRFASQVQPYETWHGEFGASLEEVVVVSIETALKQPPIPFGGKQVLRVIERKEIHAGK